MGLTRHWPHPRKASFGKAELHPGDGLLAADSRSPAAHFVCQKKADSGSDPPYTQHLFFSKKRQREGLEGENVMDK